MKKSKLKNIIKEQIKQLMTEQTTGEIVYIKSCSGLPQVSDHFCAPAGTQVGDRFTLDQSSISFNYSFTGGEEVFVITTGIIHPATGVNTCPDLQSVTPNSAICDTCCQDDGSNGTGTSTSMFLNQPGSTYGCCGSPTNVGPQGIDNSTLQVADPITPTPNPNDPQVKRMKYLAIKRR